MEILQNYKLILGIVTALLAVVLFIPYIRDILQRKTEPHIYTWLIWTILQIVGVLAAYKDGAGFGVWGLAVGSFFCFAIFLLSFKYGTKNISRFDLYCLAAAIVAMGVYFILENALLAVILVSIIDFVGFMPSFRKGFQEPYTETISTFALSSFGNVLSFAALENYSLISTLYIASLIFTNGSFALMLYFRRKFLNKINNI